MSHRCSGRRSFAGNRDGAAALEFALVALPLLALIIAGLQTGLVYVSDAALELATEKTARTVLTGAAQNGNLTQAQFLASLCSKLPSILYCPNVMVDAQVYSAFSSANTSQPTITYNANGTVSNSWNFNLGTAGSIVVLRVIYLMPVIAGPLKFNLANTTQNRRVLMATAVFKNEPYK